MNIIEKKGVVFGEGRPKICVPLVGDSIDALEEEANNLLGGPADLLEIRIDYFVKNNGMKDVLSAVKAVHDIAGEMPIIFTFRTKDEGGECEILKNDYSKLLIDAAGSGYVDFVDLELNLGEEYVKELCAKVKAYSCGVIISNHDFEKTVSFYEISDRMINMENLGADIAKVAMMPLSDEDVVTLLLASVKIKNKLSIPFITISMGKLGAISRLWGNLSGSVVTFATADNNSAPGQMDALKVLECLNMLN